MIKMYQKSWFDIDFKSLGNFDQNQIADQAFYHVFYQAFYAKYHSDAALPESYRRNKKNTAKHLAEIISNKQAKKVLSIGSGNGMIEKELSTLLPDLEIIAFEPSNIHCAWPQENPKIKFFSGSFPDCFHQNKHFDLVYLSTVDYALSDESYEHLLTDIKTLTSSPVILTNVITPYPTVLAFIKYWIKIGLAKLNLYQLGQFWGYLRHCREHERIFQKSGYKIVSSGKLKNHLIWLEIAPTNGERL